jgi:SNF2 family DNA or RNA helicase
MDAMLMWILGNGYYSFYFPLHEIVLRRKCKERNIVSLNYKVEMTQLEKEKYNLMKNEGTYLYNSDGIETNYRLSALFSCLLGCRQLCANPAVFVRGLRKKGENVSYLEETSSKNRALLKLLSSIRSKQVVALSNWTDHLFVVAKFLSNVSACPEDKKHLNPLGFNQDLFAAAIKTANTFECMIVSGSTNPITRNRIIKEFETNHSRRKLLLMTYNMASVLSLPNASHCILLDPHWNPTTETRAVSKISGLENTTYVHRLIATNHNNPTIEQTIIDKHLSKRKLMSVIEIASETVSDVYGR